MLDCPCCARAVARPNAQAVSLALGLCPQQKAILESLLAGRGRPVPVAAMIARMYQDVEPPDDTYLAFKVALCRMRRPLAAIGLTIEHVGRGLGYVARWASDAERSHRPQEALVRLRAEG